VQGLERLLAAQPGLEHLEHSLDSGPLLGSELLGQPGPWKRLLVAQTASDHSSLARRTRRRTQPSQDGTATRGIVIVVAVIIDHSRCDRTVDIDVEAECAARDGHAVEPREETIREAVVWRKGSIGVLS
jgi:hypothetical protein